MSNSAGPGRLVRGLFAGVALVTGGAALATGRAVVDGEVAVLDADAALRRKDGAEATAKARAAASWYVPGAPHVPAAYARLQHIARTSEAEGDRDAALLAWRAMRSAAIETRWLAQPHRRELDMANAAIARLSSEGPKPLIARDEAEQQAERRALEALSREGAGRSPWAIALLVGLGLACGGAAWAARRGVGPEGELDPARLKLPLLVAAAGLLLYALAAWQA